MKSSLAAVLAGVSLFSAMSVSAPAIAATYTDAPDMDFSLPDTNVYQYKRESLAVLTSGDFWLCAQENNAPFSTYVVKFAADSTTGDSSIQTIDLSYNASSCDDLALDLEGNLYVGLNDTVRVYSPDASGVATPIREFTNANLNIDVLAFDEAGAYLYAVTNGDIWSFPRESSGSVLPDRIINGGDLDGGDLYVAATAGGTVFVADYDGGAVRVFDLGNDGPVWDRQFWLDGSYDTRSFGGITLNGERLFATYQDGSNPGVYAFAIDSDGMVMAIDSWSGSNVVVSGTDALYDVAVAACVDHMVTFEGYNDRVLTWTGQPMVCPDPEPTPDPELPNTGADLTSATGFVALAVLALVTGVALVARRRVA